MFAFVFDSVSGGEWLVLLAVILIIVGPKNLPSAARKLGEITSKLRRAADEFKRQLMTMDEEMRRTADDIKKEYIDIPEDGSEKDITELADGSDEPYGYNPEDPDYPGEYPDGYPEEDYYGMDDSGPSMDEPSDGASGEGSLTEVADAQASSPTEPQASASTATPEASEKTNG
jgi:sec-independent protein translocase protein TatB